MSTDTSEKGLESLIVADMTARGWVAGNPRDYDRAHAIDLVQLRAFVHATQPRLVEAFDLDRDSPTRQKFLARLRDQITKRGTIDVMRNGVKHGPHDLALFYGTPTPGNAKATQLHAANRFSVTRQLRFSADETGRSLDLGLFVNGLPVATFELKNNLTKQTVLDAVEQYKGRPAAELLFGFGRCVVHFALDEQEVRFCTHLRGKASWFLPFNRGHDDGAGNPPNPDGLKTDYLWKRILTPAGLTDILENYAQITEAADGAGKTKRRQVFPRFHQLEVVRRLLADVRTRGVGRKYLIQHSAGSGKSNSIAWLAHQLIGLEGKTVVPLAPVLGGEGLGVRGSSQGAVSTPSPPTPLPLSTGGERSTSALFDSVIVITDRRVLDRQIADTINQFVQVGAMIGHAEHSGDLARFIMGGKKIIISTVQKFPVLVADSKINADLRGRRFAILIDEAHSSQGGRTSNKMSVALSEDGEDDDEETVEDKINTLMEAHKLLPNASYFAFTATPKNKTLEIFGEPVPSGDETKHRPFHAYTMKQAIQEGFILDVLKNYTPIGTYYKLVKTAEQDPEYDVAKAQKRLRARVEEDEHAIRSKALEMIDHFHKHVYAPRKIAGQARAMVVTGSIRRAVEYFHAFRAILGEQQRPYKAIVAFSGEPEFRGAKVSEAILNGFPSGQIEAKFEEEGYRFLICADKFQTGYDQPLLHTMYVDKPLSGIKAVQTLSRLNRAHPDKHDVFVLDFRDQLEAVKEGFADYYRTTILSEETDSNRLNDLEGELAGARVYTPTQVDDVIERFLNDKGRDRLDPILDACVATYREHLDEAGQVRFKGNAKMFCRAYQFLASILPFNRASWEKLSIFLDLLVPKLPAPVEEDASRGILELIDMDSYRLEKKTILAIALADADAEIDPVPTGGGGGGGDPERDRLSNILKTFNDLFGNIPWQDKDRIARMVAVDIPSRLADDEPYQNANEAGDRENARIEANKAVRRIVFALMKDDMELFKQFSDNESFRDWVTKAAFDATFARR